MPFMPCNHTGCNETVKVPTKYCHKHTPFEQDIKASDLLEVSDEDTKATNLTVKVDTGKVAKEVIESIKTKKTTK